MVFLVVRISWDDRTLLRYSDKDFFLALIEHMKQVHPIDEIPVAVWMLGNMDTAEAERYFSASAIAADQVKVTRGGIWGGAGDDCKNSCRV